MWFRDKLFIEVFKAWKFEERVLSLRKWHRMAGMSYWLLASMLDMHTTWLTVIIGSPSVDCIAFSLNNITSMWVNAMTSILMAGTALMRFVAELLAIRYFDAAAIRIIAFIWIPAKIKVESGCVFLWTVHTHTQGNKGKSKKNVLGRWNEKKSRQTKIQ